MIAARRAGADPSLARSRPVRRLLLLSSACDVWSGWSTFTWEVAGALHRAHDVQLYLPVDAARCAAPPCRVAYALPSIAQSLRHPRQLLAHLFPMIAADGAEVVHSLTDHPSTVLLAGRLAARHQLPLVISAQGTFADAPLTHSLRGRWLRRTYRQAAHVTAPSDFTTQRLRTQLGSQSPPVSRVPNGVRVERFASAHDVSALRARFGPGPILLSVGALKPRKGQDLVLRAFAQIKRQWPSAVYLLIGPDQWHGTVQRLAADLRIPDAHFLGPMDGEALAPYYQLCDLFVLTPRHSAGVFEGFGMVYLEAGASGKPVIGTRSGGVAEVIRDGQTGWLVPEDDVPALTAAIQQLLEWPAQARALGAAGVAHAQSYAWSHVVRQLCAIYEELLA